jgi:hypothetical protein
MEQPCYKCGQVVEQGIPFCPHCAAPQIRVVIAEPPPILAVAADGTGAAVLPASQTAPVLALPMSWSQSLKPCALAALIAALTMVLKLMVPLIAALGAGFLAVAFYRRNNPAGAIHAGAGARLGALCGLLCSAMTAILASLRVAILHEGNDVRNTLLEGIRQTAERYTEPQFQASLEFMRSPAGLMFMLGVMLFFGTLLFLVLGTLGGALGGAILGHRPRNQ